MIAAKQHDKQICVANCGLPGDLCACYRQQMQVVFASLAARQEPLGPDFERVWDENKLKLYESE